MTLAVQTTETIEFTCEEWIAARTPQGELVSVNPVPGTWTLLSGEDRRKFAERGIDVKGLCACPRCKAITIIPESYKPILHQGDTAPSGDLRCNQCDHVCRIVLKQWDQRKLYCACYEAIINGTVRLLKTYLHAVDDQEALKFFWAQHTPLEVSKLVGIAPAIGFFVQDTKNDRILTTD